jgi:hypothetical protein
VGSSVLPFPGYDSVRSTHRVVTITRPGSLHILQYDVRFLDVFWYLSFTRILSNSMLEMIY